MKLYVWGPAPNPRRVKIFLAEKGLSVPIEDVGDGMQLSADYKAKYPFAIVPMLELDDGTQISEAMAICRYFETLNPTPPLMGTDAKDKAIVEMWERKAYEEGMNGAADQFRNAHPAFVDRGISGYAAPVKQLPGLVARGRQRLEKFFDMFDSQLADNEFVTGKRVTVADITALCAIDFAKMFSNESIPSHCKHVLRWHEAMCSRPSAKV